MKNKLRNLAVLILVSTLLSSCMMMGRILRGGGSGKMGSAIPSEYLAQQNPVQKTSEAIQQGTKLYQSNCMSCHGATALGDGVVAKDLSPQPTNLQNLVTRVNDDYLFWRISETRGWQTSVMPEFKEILTKEERWKIILFLRSA